MSQVRKTLTAFVLGLICFLSTQPALAGETLYQYSTIDALLAGLYDGQLTLQDLKYQGDFGLGTLNGLDGELVVLDGQAYHVSAGGKAVIPADSTPIPFGAVAFFEEDSIHNIAKVDSLKALNDAMLKALPSKNVFFAIRIDGRFNHVKARAIPKQAKPYPPLAQAAKKQVVVQFTGKGTLVGIYSPAFVKGVGVPGFHWHFLTEDRSGGGHVLDLAMPKAVARMDELRMNTVQLPNSREFDEVDLTQDKSKELHAVETDPAKK